MAKLFGSLELLYKYYKDYSCDPVTNDNLDYLLNNLVIDHETKFAENVYIRTISDVMYKQLISDNVNSETNINISINNKFILDYVKSLYTEEKFNKHAAFLTYHSFDLQNYYESYILVITSFTNIYRYYNDPMLHNENTSTMYMLHGKTLALNLKVQSKRIIEKLTGRKLDPKSKKEPSIILTNEVI